MGKEIITIQPISNSYWECNEPWGFVRRYIQLYENGIAVQNGRCTFDSHQDWLKGVENLRCAASIINSSPSKKDHLSKAERELYETKKIQNILCALSGWQLFIYERYPNLEIESNFNWPSFPMALDIEGKTILCKSVYISSKSRTYVIMGRNKETDSNESYEDELSVEELELIRKILRVGLLTQLKLITTKLAFSHKGSLSKYIESGFIE